MNDDPLWTGELGLTYLHRNYEDASIRTANTLGLSGSLTWSPTELTRVVMETGTAIKEASGTGSSPTPTWTAGIDVTQAIRDNVDLTAGIGVEVEDFGSSVDKTYDANLGLSWKFNPILAWTAAYDLTWLDSGSAGSSYVEHRVSTGLTLSR